MRIHSVQKVNKYKQTPDLNFGVHLGEIKGLETVRPDLSNLELNKFYRTLELRLSRDEFSNNRSVDYDLKRIDEEFIECTVKGSTVGNPVAVRIREVTEDILAALAPRG